MILIGNNKGTVFDVKATVDHATMRGKMERVKYIGGWVVWATWEDEDGKQQISSDMFLDATDSDARADREKSKKAAIKWLYEKSKF